MRWSKKTGIVLIVGIIACISFSVTWMHLRGNGDPECIQRFYTQYNGEVRHGYIFINDYSNIS